MDDQTYNLILSKMKKYFVEVHLDKDFSELTTLGVGGAIRLTLYPDSIRKLVKVVRLLRKLKVQTYILGKGSNVLASDGFFDGAVIVTSKLNEFKIHKNCAYVQCGTSTAKLSRALQQRGLSGGEFLACLPATVGGAIVCNAGCFNQDINSILRSVKVFYRGKIRALSVKNCHFTKRNSLFKHSDDYTVLSAKFKLTQSTPDRVNETTKQMLAEKARKQPLNYRSAGCMLYHDSVAISRLIDMAGLKGYAIGGAIVSNKHAGFVLNVDKATSWDIYLLVQHIVQTIWERFGIRAQLEVCLVNFSNTEIDLYG